jgi:hypothetical protein
MDLDISGKIERLPKKKLDEFREELKQNLYDENWCERTHIDYKNPDIKKAKRILFRDKYSKIPLEPLPPQYAISPE